LRKSVIVLVIGRWCFLLFALRSLARAGQHGRAVWRKALFPGNDSSEHRQRSGADLAIAGGIAAEMEGIPLAAVLGTAAALIASDAHDTPHLRRTSDVFSFNKAMTSNHTAAVIVAVPAALLVIGRVSHNSKATGTALLAAETLADSWVVGTVLKDAFMRARPVRPHALRVCDCHHCGAPLWQSPLGTVCEPGAGERGGALARHRVGAFLFRRFRWRRAGILDQPVRRAGAISA
jgi:hypothetical protein